MSVHLGPAVIPSGRERWLSAGQDLLRSGGIRAVKLDALTAATGLTSGSFYHHFASVEEFHTALARYYGTEQTSSLLERIVDDDPLDRLRTLEQLARDEIMRPLDAAMRDWAGSDPIAAAAVREADRELLTFVATNLEALGLSRGDARQRAVLLLAVGVARITPPWPQPPDAADRLLAFLTNP